MTSSEFPSSESSKEEEAEDSGSDIEVIGHSDIEDAVTADEAETKGSTMTEYQIYLNQISKLIDCLNECDEIEGKSEEPKPKPAEQQEEPKLKPVERERESRPSSAAAEAPATEPKTKSVTEPEFISLLEIMKEAWKWIPRLLSVLPMVVFIVVGLSVVVENNLSRINRDTCVISTKEQVTRWNSLHAEAKTEIFGQHIAIEGSMRAVYAHMTDPDSKKGLVLSFHGWLGSGKTFLSHLIAKHMFEGGLNSPYVKSFHGPRHFTHDPAKLHEYQATLVQTIESTVRSCTRSIFIFDEVDKMPSSVFNSLVPLLGHNGFIDGTDYSKATFIFISNTGGERINNLTLSHLKSGKPRSDLSLHDFRQIVAEGAFNEAVVGGSYFTPPTAVLEYFQSFTVFLNDLQQSNENVQRLKKAVAATPMWKALKSSYQGFMGPQSDTTSQGQGGLFQSELITRRLVDHYIPFLPLEKEHVILCAKREIKRRNTLYVKPEEIVDRLLFFPKGNAVFAEDGCKNIHAHVGYYVHDSSDF